MSPPNSVVPSELKLSKAWDLCIERGIYRTVIGTLVGGMVAVVLCRKCVLLIRLHVSSRIFVRINTGTPSKRFAGTMFGTGFGAGSAWGLSAVDFENEKK